MKRMLFTGIFLFAIQFLNAQESEVAKQKKLLATSTNDSVKLGLLGGLYVNYIFSYPDSAVEYVRQEILLARKMQSDQALAEAYRNYSQFFATVGDYPQALHYALEAIRLVEKPQYWLTATRVYHTIASIYNDQGDYQNAMLNVTNAKSLFVKNWPNLEEKINTPKEEYWDTVWDYLFVQNVQIEIYFNTGQLDSALKYLQMNDKTMKKMVGENDDASVLEKFGNIYRKRGDYAIALPYYHTGLAIASAKHDAIVDVMKNALGLANTFKATRHTDSSIYFANKVLSLSKATHNPLLKLDALNILADLYKSAQKGDSAAKYLDMIIATREYLFSQKKVMELQRIQFDEQIRQQEQAKQQYEFRNRVKLYSLFAALAVFLGIGFLLFRNNRQKQMANELLTEEKAKVESTLDELRKAQVQLIQSEKMASLGELTAGIAHEIQNPLNFVNNFSEVNSELLQEMKSAIDRKDFVLADQLRSDLERNMAKINEHGKRADSIVKGMLQHSRQSSGTKELIDVNKLCDEYLHLAYHGMRAKDKSFNAEIKSDFHPSINKVLAIPQDFGRVLLNLCNNAFYAVNEKAKVAADGYKSLVTMSTRQQGNFVEIIVRDNGPGIPEKFKEKVFQPFFTTKPTGQGTGLGLSISYDIVKAMGGEIKVESKDGQWTEFSILLNGVQA